MVFLTENWFWRGTQSAIFYYAACTPWVEFKHKRKRRKDAVASQKQRNEIIARQPGTVPQPNPFETNEGWAEEILKGPHPPKGWKKDPIYYKYAKRMKEVPDSLDCTRVDTATSSSTPGKNDWAALTSAPPTPLTPTPPQGPLPFTREGMSIELLSNLGEGQRLGPTSLEQRRLRSASDTTASVQQPSLEMSSTAVESQPSSSPVDIRGHCASSNESDTTRSRRASFESGSVSEKMSQTPRPSMDRRLSQAVDTFKEAVRTTLHPDKWNWIRYERDDEILSNLNDKVKSMWGNVTGQSNLTGEDHEAKLKRLTSENQVKKWQRGTHPAINDLHPPVVSQLPYTAEEARWMLLPPPSADVMMGRSRPDPFDDFNRTPLSVVGRPIKIEAPQRDKSPQTVGSEDDTSEAVTDSEEDSSDGEWFTGISHVQKPQRAHLRKHRMASAP